MKVTYQSSDKFTVEFDVSNHKELFAQVARFEEVFSNTVCGQCGGDNTKFVTRNVTKDGKQFTFHEVRCQNPQCRAKLEFGELSDGSGNMFPKRKNENGDYKGKYGWYRWDGGNNTPEPVAAVASSDDDVPF